MGSAAGTTGGVPGEALGAEPGEVLRGGNANRGLVVRVGDTVRRPQHRWSAATHALLLHLEDVGFEGAPRFLGVDAAGREVLRYVEGDVPVQPYAPAALGDAALAGLAGLLRDLHRALAGFDAAAHDWPRPVPGAFRDGTVSHNDVKPENVVLRGGRPVALIDFDLAAPGSRLWDLATAARTWVPLRDERDVHDARRGRAAHRLRVLLDAYGDPVPGLDRLADAVPATVSWRYRPVLDGAASGHPGFSAHWALVGERTARARRWCAEELPRLVAEVL